jgi:hypothetical protein
MIPLIGTISKTAKKVPGGPIVQGVVVLALLLVTYYVLRAVIRGIGKGLGTLLDPPVNPQELVDETPTADNTDLTEDEEDAFALTAQSIAQSQYNAMQGTGTDETALFSSIVNLNGSQLQQVFAEYGIKEGKNLFDWYASELADTQLGSVYSYYCGSGWGASFDCEDGQSAGCESWFDQCTERDFARSIWQKSGLPITF